MRVRVRNGERRTDFYLEVVGGYFPEKGADDEPHHDVLHQMRLQELLVPDKEARGAGQPDLCEHARMECVNCVQKQYLH